jgi:hypothetical protein
MLGASDVFAWRAWAEGGGFNPGRQEYNDFHSLDAAGSPYPGSAYYPVKSLVGVDNTCVVSHGAPLAQALPGYCGTSVVGKNPAGAPPDDQVYAPGGGGVVVRLDTPPAGSPPENQVLVIPGGILPTAAP